MRLLAAAPMIAAAAAVAAPAAAQAPQTRDARIATLARQDAGLRAQIARLQLDALIARVDQTVTRSHPVAAQDKAAGPFRTDVERYTY